MNPNPYWPPKDVGDFARYGCGIELNARQHAYLARQYAHPSGRSFIAEAGDGAARGWGQTTVTLIDALYYAVHHPRSQQVILTGTAAQAKEAWNTLFAWLHQGPLASMVGTFSQQPVPMVGLREDAHIVFCWNEALVRGRHVDRLLRDVPVPREVPA